MAITYLKHGKPAADRAEDDAKTAAVVAATLKDIEERGDTAVRELANKFDGYDRGSYRLSQDEIDALIAKVSPRDLEDIKFAQAQVVNFAQAQRDSMLDIEVETMPGVILGHQTDRKAYRDPIYGFLESRRRQDRGQLGECRFRPCRSTTGCGPVQRSGLGSL